MTPLVWANFPLALLFIAAFAGIPLWLTFRQRETQADHSPAHAYLAAKAAPARQGGPFVTGQPMVPQVAASPAITAAAGGPSRGPSAMPLRVPGLPHAGP